MQSTFIRYERSGDKVRAVRVTKQWVTREVPARDSRREPAVQSKFIAVRVSQVPMRQLKREPVLDEDGLSVPRSSGGDARVESRERMMTLLAKDGEPVLQEAGYSERWLPLGDLSRLTAAQARQALETQWGGE